MTRNIKVGDTARFPYCSLYDVNTAYNVVTQEEMDKFLSTVNPHFGKAVEEQLSVVEEYLAEDVEYALRAVHREGQYNG